MNITYFDTNGVAQKGVETEIKKLATYREKVAGIIDAADFKSPEASLATWSDEKMLESVYELTAKFKKPKHVVVVGIGGSSLGVEAIHSVLATPNKPTLHILDAVSAFELSGLLHALKPIKKAEQVVVCVVSKSGGTTETLANASVLLDALEGQFGKSIYKQCVAIGDKSNPLLSAGKKLGMHVLPMHEQVGGRYSVFTSVGLFPLAVLGHDIEALLSGVQDATAFEYEEAVAESAARLHLYMKKGYRHVNFYAFDTRLVRLGKWYRQLTAESLGKSETLDKQPVKIGFVPTVSTPVELHSMAQLYFSGFKGVYTDFVSFDDTEYDFEISKKTKLATSLKGKSMQEIHTAIYGGVIGAYQERELPYRATLLDEDLTHSLGTFMGMRMLETMYIAHLMNVDAFNQPNVEVYKKKTKKILDV